MFSAGSGVQFRFSRCCWPHPARWHSRSSLSAPPYLPPPPYTDDFWKPNAGKTVQELGAEWQKWIASQLKPPASE